jgi:hypothetical protein
VVRPSSLRSVPRPPVSDCSQACFSDPASPPDFFVTLLWAISTRPSRLPDHAAFPRHGGTAFRLADARIQSHRLEGQILVLARSLWGTIVLRFCACHPGPWPDTAVASHRASPYVFLNCRRPRLASLLPCPSGPPPGGPSLSAWPPLSTPVLLLPSLPTSQSEKQEACPLPQRKIFQPYHALRMPRGCCRRSPAVTLILFQVRVKGRSQGHARGAALRGGWLHNGPARGALWPEHRRQHLRAEPPLVDGRQEDCDVVRQRHKRCLRPGGGTPSPSLG